MSKYMKEKEDRYHCPREMSMCLSQGITVWKMDIAWQSLPIPISPEFDSEYDKSTVPQEEERLSHSTVVDVVG